MRLGVTQRFGVVASALFAVPVIIAAGKIADEAAIRVQDRIASGCVGTLLAMKEGSQPSVAEVTQCEEVGRNAAAKEELRVWREQLIQLATMLFFLWAIGCVVIAVWRWVIAGRKHQS